MLDLFNKKYDMDILKKYIYSISLYDILKTQIITADFALHYILNINYQLTPEEENIKIVDVLTFQPHLKNTDLLSRYESNINDINNTNNKRKDSWNEFEINAI